MDIANKIYAYLSQSVLLTDKVSTRIYPNVAETGTAEPYVVYTIVSDVPEYTLDGNTQLSQKRVQISVWGTKYLTVHQVSKIIDDLMDDWHETDTTIGSTRKNNSVDRHEPTTKFHGVISDYMVFC